MAQMKTSLDLSARFDFCAYNNEVCLIINHKTGFNEPDPVKLNAQMRVEVLLIAANLARVGIRPKRFVAQLNTMMFGVMEESFTYGELSGIWQTVTEALHELENPHAQLNPSPATCKHCPAILVCDAVKSMNVKLNPIDTNPKALAQSLDKIALMREYADELEAFCIRGLTHEPPEFEIPGYAMVPGAERRDWKDLKAAQVTMAEHDIPINGLKTHTVAAYEKLYAKKYDKKPEEVREAFHQMMDGVIERKQNRASLKPV